MIKGLPPPPPRNHVPAYRIREVLCKSHTAYMTSYTAKVGQEPKGQLPYGSLDGAKGAPALTSTGRMCISGKLMGSSIGNIVRENGYWWS